MANDSFGNLLKHAPSSQEIKNQKEKIQLIALHQLLCGTRRDGPAAGENSNFQYLVFGSLLLPALIATFLSGVPYLEYGEEDTARVPGLPYLTAPPIVGALSSFTNNFTLNFYFSLVVFSKLVLDYWRNKRIKKDVYLPTDVARDATLFFFTSGLTLVSAVPQAALSLKHYPKFEGEVPSFIVNLVVYLILNGIGSNRIVQGIVGPVWDYLSDVYYEKFKGANQRASDNCEKFLYNFGVGVEDLYHEIRYLFNSKHKPTRYVGMRSGNVDTLENRIDYLKENPNLLYDVFNKKVNLDKLTVNELKGHIHNATDTYIDDLKNEENKILWKDSIARSLLIFLFELGGLAALTISLYGYVYLSKDTSERFFNDGSWAAGLSLFAPFFALVYLVNKSTIRDAFANILEPAVAGTATGVTKIIAHAKNSKKRADYEEIRDNDEIGEIKNKEANLGHVRWKTYHFLAACLMLVTLGGYYFGFESSSTSIALNGDADKPLTSEWSRWVSALGAAIFNGAGIKGLALMAWSYSLSWTKFSRHYLLNAQPSPEHRSKNIDANAEKYVDSISEEQPNKESDPLLSNLDDLDSLALKSPAEERKIKEVDLRKKLGIASDFFKSVNPHSEERDYQTAYESFQSACSVSV